MSRLQATSAKKNIIFSAIASFAGMIAAVPVSIAIVSAAQPAHAVVQQQPATDTSYAQYAQAYTQGYLANVKQSVAPSSSGCAEAQQASEAATPTTNMPATASVPMSQDEWTQNVSNSYNNYVTTTNTNTHISTTNVNSNNTTDSNNTANSTVVVAHSDGAVVTTGTSATGNNVNHVDVDNKDSNNTVVVKDSFNQDSHDKVTNTTTNVTTVVNDSFNHQDKTVKVNSGNKVDNSHQDNSHDYTKLENNYHHI